MGNAIQFKVTGDKELARAFKNLGEQSDQIIMERLKRVAHSIADVMEDKFMAASGRPINKRYIKTGLTKKGNPYASIVVITGEDELEERLEYGASKTEPIMWMRSTLRSDKTKSVLREEIEQAIDEIIKRERTE